MAFLFLSINFILFISRSERIERNEAREREDNWRKEEKAEGGSSWRTRSVLDFLAEYSP
jgi:hypothetical protein